MTALPFRVTYVWKEEGEMTVHLVYPVLPLFYVRLRRDVSDFIELYLSKYYALDLLRFLG